MVETVTPRGDSPGTPPPGNAGRGCKPILIGMAIAFGALLLLGIGIFTLVWRATAGPADAADRFLNVTATEGPAVAWAQSASGFRAAVPQDAWAIFARQSGFTAYKSSSWTTRAIENDQGHLEGSITLADGGKVPLKVDLIKEQGGWKVLGIGTTARAGIDYGSDDPANGTAPVQPGISATVPPPPSPPPDLPGLRQAPQPGPT